MINAGWIALSGAPGVWRWAAGSVTAAAGCWGLASIRGKGWWVGLLQAGWRDMYETF